jgi:hypothetical protein
MRNWHHKAIKLDEALPFVSANGRGGSWCDGKADRVGTRDTGSSWIKL